MLLENICPVCHRYSHIMHGHHIVPRRIGGKDSPSNIVGLCPKCHREAEAGKISRSLLRTIAKEQHIIQKLLEGEEEALPFEAEVLHYLTLWASTDFKIHELCAFAGGSFQFCLHPPSFDEPRFYPQAMISLWLAGKLSSPELLEKIAYGAGE